MEDSATDTGEVVRIVSRRVVRPESPDGGAPSSEPPEVMHLTPWDLRMIAVDYIQKGILLPKPPTGGAQLVDALAASFARALVRFYPLAGRLAVAEAAANPAGSPGIVVSLVCNGEGAEFVHSVADELTVRDIAGPVYIPPVVWSLFPLNGVLGADAALDSRPLLAAQVTELADGVFLAVSLNHAVADGTTFWHLFNTWSEITRRSGGSENESFELSSPAPALERWFLDGSPVPITLPFAKLEDVVRRPEYPPVQECFFHFSAESVRRLKAKANAEMSRTTAPATTTTTTISSLQSVLAHLWIASCRARDLTDDQETTHGLLVGCRARVRGIPAEYMGNTVTRAVARAPAGDVRRKGLGWAAWLLNRAAATFDEASVREELAAWAESPSFVRVKLPPAGAVATALVTGSSPRFDVYGNDFGWGRPMSVRSGAGNKMDGKVTVYEGGEGAGSMALEVCLAPAALARLVADEEFMEAVSAAGAA